MLKIRVLNRYNLVVALLVFFSPISVSCSEPDMKQYSKNEIAELIHVGDSYTDILKILGKPTSDDIMMKKETSTKIGRRLMYIYEQQDESVFNQKTDKYLRLWFGPDELLLELDYHEGLSSE
jgi:hypothetical protein